MEIIAILLQKNKQLYKKNSYVQHTRGSWKGNFCLRIVFLLQSSWTPEWIRCFFGVQSPLPFVGILCLIQRHHQ
jgi:hypothetical protein